MRTTSATLLGMTVVLVAVAFWAVSSFRGGSVDRPSTAPDSQEAAGFEPEEEHHEASLRTVVDTRAQAQAQVETRAQASAIEGRVVGPDQVPVAGALVELLGSELAEVTILDADRAERIVTIAEGVTDVDGRFSVGVAPGQRFDLRVAPLQANLETVLMPGCSSGQQVTVVLQYSCSVSGQVTLDGRAVEGARVQLSWKEPEGTLETTKVWTGVDGRFLAQGLPPGTFLLETTPTEGQSSKVKVNLSGGEHRVLDISLVAGARIRGVVLAMDSKEPIVGAQVSLDRDYFRQSTTDAGGTFELLGANHESVPEGLYARAVGYAESHRDFSANAVEDLEFVTLLLKPGARAVGRVVSQDGEPIARASVVATGFHGNRVAGWTGSSSSLDGAFSLDGIETEIPQVLIVRRPFRATRILGFPETGTDGLFSFGDIELQVAGQISGQVVDTMGRGLDGFDIGLRSPQSTLHATSHPIAAVSIWLDHMRGVKSSNGGFFTFGNLESGTYEILASLQSGGDSWTKRASVRLEQPGAVAQARIVFPADSGISGKVLDKKGGVLEGITVTLYLQGDKPRFQGIVKTSDSGTFRFHGVPPGYFRVDVSAPPDGRVAGASFPGIPAGSTDLRLTMPWASTVTGFALDAREELLPYAHVFAMQGDSVLSSTMSDESGRFSLRVPEDALVDVAVQPTIRDEESPGGRNIVGDPRMGGRAHLVAPGTVELVIRTAWAPD